MDKLSEGVILKRWVFISDRDETWQYYGLLPDAVQEYIYTYGESSLTSLIAVVSS